MAVVGGRLSCGVTMAVVRGRLSYGVTIYGSGWRKDGVWRNQLWQWLEGGWRVA